MTLANQKLSDKMDREIKSTQEKCALDLDTTERELKEMIRSFQRQRARDRADQDLAFKGAFDDILHHTEKLEEFQINFEAVAIVNSMLIENINMQLESEIADLLDRRMMSLFGVDGKPITKVDAQNTTRKL